jgi:hypothetical protein
LLTRPERLLRDQLTRAIADAADAGFDVLADAWSESSADFCDAVQEYLVERLNDLRAAIFRE